MALGSGGGITLGRSTVGRRLSAAAAQSKESERVRRIELVSTASCTPRRRGGRGKKAGSKGERRPGGTASGEGVERE
eukprot:scaffold297931_cov27-Tisochrysis_lutea.AAC.3